MNDDGITDNLEIGDAYLDEESEQTVLGTVFADPNAWGVAASLRPFHFGNVIHALVWECCHAVAARGDTVTTTTVTEELRIRNRKNTALGHLGSLEGLALSYGSTIANLESAVHTVRQLASARRTARAGQRIALASKSVPVRPPTEYLAWVAREMAAVDVETADARPQSAQEGVDQWLAQFDTVQESDKRVSQFGVSTLDEKIGDGLGLEEKKLYVVGARPAVGKTALALSAVLATAQRGGKCLVHSLEMAANELIGRMISMLSGVDLLKVKRRSLTPDERDRVFAAANDYYRLPIWIRDKAGQRFSEIRACTLTEHLRAPLALVVIDHLHIVAPESGTQADSVVARVEYTSGASKQLAKDLNAPVMLLAQLNRLLTQRPDKRPQIGDLRGGGSIEQDADVVLLIHREEVHDPDTSDKGFGEVYLAKQRDAPMDRVRVRYVDYLTKFTDVDQDRPKLRAVPSPPAYSEVSSDEAEGDT